MQDIFDDLYAKSKEKFVFTNLYDIIIKNENIMLAYREIKSNKGSTTAGTNQKTIKDWENVSQEEYTTYIRKRLQNFHPHKVKRVYIPKGNGNTRPLGIPTMEDRLIQQCIKQVLEPILEAKFYPQSYGFRPNRSTHHAVAEVMRTINRSHAYYVIDVDIKGFFDNVNHGKLLKQLWSLGIRDKKLISVISRMLKAEIEGEGNPTKGTPQGGILSPLLANVVLNELDWWIDSQWRSFNIKERTNKVREDGTTDNSNTYTYLKKETDLKEMRIVRYADDFKILCMNEDTANKTFIAVKLWLKERLGLEVSEEKSKVIDVRKEASEFLGFSLRAIKKGEKWVIHSRITEKAKRSAIDKLKANILEIKKNPTNKNVSRYNSTVLGLQNYYQIATHVNPDFSRIEFILMTYRHNSLKGVMTNKGEPSTTYKTIYKGYNYKKQFVANTCLFPIPAVKHKNPMGFRQVICDYTKLGREMIHTELKINVKLLRYLMENPMPNDSIELSDNRVSLYSAQNGKCAITKVILELGNMEIHHIKPKHLGGTDEYKNLIWVTADIHKLIHATTEETVGKYLSRVKGKEFQIDKLNKLRKKAGNCVIEQ